MRIEEYDMFKLEGFLQDLKDKITRLVDFVMEEYPEEIDKCEEEDVVDIVIRLLKEKGKKK